ncbi:17267_t:CDS:2, partial [Racocetra fulgida]
VPDITNSSQIAPHIDRLEFKDVQNSFNELESMFNEIKTKISKFRPNSAIIYTDIRKNNVVISICESTKNFQFIDVIESLNPIINVLDCRNRQAVQEEGNEIVDKRCLEGLFCIRTVVLVGDGLFIRGLLVKKRDDKYLITAGHCFLGYPLDRTSRVDCFYKPWNRTTLQRQIVGRSIRYA